MPTFYYIMMHRVTTRHLTAQSNILTFDPKMRFNLTSSDKI